MSRAVLFALLLSAGLRAPVLAQSTAGAGVASADVAPVIAAPDAMPGAVVGQLVRVPRPARGAHATYSIVAAAGVVLYGPPAGDVVIRPDAGLVPLTFSVPQGTAAGMMRIARMEVRWSDGTGWTADVRARVLVRRGIVLDLDTTSVRVARGAARHVRVHVRNTGNAADTIRLGVLKPAQWAMDVPAPRVLEAGASYVDSLRIRMPANAVNGEAQIVGITARGVGSEATRTLVVTVADERVADRGELRLPTTITVGAVDAGLLGETPVSFALETEGSLGGGTEASLRLRRSPAVATPPAFYEYLAGPGLRLELRNGMNRVTAGDVLFVGSPLHGGGSFGTGIDARAQLGRVNAAVFAARPHQFDAPERPGHLLGATAELSTGVGALGLSVSDMARPAGIVDETERARLAALTWRTTLLQGLTTRAEAGIMTLRDEDGRARQGAAFDVASTWHGERLDLQARVRRVPGSLATSGAAADETYLGGAYDLGHSLSLSGWYVRNEAELLNGRGTRHDGSALTMRWQGGGASAQVSGYTRRTSGTGLLTGDTEQRSVALGGAVPLGPVTAEATVELGRTRNRDIERPLRSITSRLSYQAGAAWAWMGLSHNSAVFGSDLTRLDAGATVRAGTIELEGRMGAWLGQNARSRLDAWASATYHVTSRTALITGIDYAPWRADRGAVRVSLGARHSLALPLPIRRRASLHGVIYEDLNGNMRRDAGEPGLADVRVRHGGMVASTDRAGRYAFYDERSRPGELQVDAGSLEVGLMLLPRDGSAAHGRVDVPVLRAAALQLSLFEDRNGNGTREPYEPVAAGAMIELSDARGRTRTASSDADGRVSFAALPPGDYSVRARTLQAQTPGTAVSVALVAGVATQLVIAAPAPRREIRFGLPPAPRTDTLTVIGRDDAKAGPLRSNDASTRPTLPGNRAPAPARALPADSPTAAAAADGPARSIPAARPTAAAPSRAAGATAAQAVALGLAVAFALLLWFVAWRRARRRDTDGA